MVFYSKQTIDLMSRPTSLPTCAIRIHLLTFVVNLEISAFFCDENVAFGLLNVENLGNKLVFTFRAKKYIGKSSYCFQNYSVGD